MDVKVSVVVTVYGTEKYLEKCLRSIKHQTFENLEVIVVNDGSGGNVEEIFHRVADGRFVYIDHGRNQGLFQARLTGIKAAGGDYLAFVDSDDYIDPDYYRLLLKEAEENDADITFAATVEDIENKGRYERIMHREIVEHGFDHNGAAGHQFFNYEGSCYALHTVWNKLYTKALFDRCVPYYEQMQEHTVMTEDIAFSVPLFYFAQKTAVSVGSIYFYCRHAGSSTVNQYMPLAKFEKHVKDMTRVFDFAEWFLKEVHADESLKVHLSVFRLRYKKLWEARIHPARAEVVQKQMKRMLEQFDARSTQNVSSDFSINNKLARWEDKTGYLKQQIGSEKFQYISFDIFDTLLQRPFYKPADLFWLLDQEFRKYADVNINFYEIRTQGEELARIYYGGKNPMDKDITLDEIYDYICRFYELDENICSALKREERMLELRYCTPRSWMKGIYDFALAAGKKVILVSDMYLDRKTVEMILEKNGYQGYDRLFLSSGERCLKSDGSLYDKVLKQLEAAPEKILHIGDDWMSDRIMAEKKKWKTFFVPKSMHVFENLYGNYKTNKCGAAAQMVCGTWIDYEKVKASPGYGAMLAMAANHYFSNPFRAFCEGSDFNQDPYFIGYYLAGMHLVGVTAWIHSILYKGKYKRIVFTARDGYLYRKVFGLSKKYYKDGVEDTYLHISRKALLPMIIKEKLDLYDLPVQFQAYSPLQMKKLLAFCSRNIPEEEYGLALDQSGIHACRCFTDRKEYHMFLKWHLDRYYDGAVHKKNQDIVKKYLSCISENDLFFDMGYSGRIQKAVSDSAGCSADAAFIHQDVKRSFAMSSAGGFHIYCYYDTTPCMSDFLREYLLSEISASCTGYEEKNGKVQPVFEDFYEEKAENMSLGLFQKGAVRFAEDFYSLFGEHLGDLPFKPFEASLPFEGFLRHAGKKDLSIFDAAFFEDEVYGGKKKISVTELVLQQLKKYGTVCK